MSKLIDINTLNKNNDYINDNINARLIDNAPKNLLRVINTTQTIDGITYTINDDKSITITGTATALGYFNLDFIDNLETAVSICPTGNLIATLGNSVSGIKMYLTFFRTDGTPIGIQKITETTTFSYPANAYKMRTCIQVDEGTVVNATIYPMIYRAGITDLTYEPYYRTQKQLDSDLIVTENETAALKSIAETSINISGNPINITDAVPLNIESAILTIEAQQSGSGEPSSINLRPIANYDSATITNIGDKTSTYQINFPENIYKGIIDITNGTITLTHRYIVRTSFTEDDTPEVAPVGLFSVCPATDCFHTHNDVLGDVICNMLPTAAANPQWGTLTSATVALNSMGRLVVTFDGGISNLEQLNAFVANNPIEFGYKLQTPVTYSINPVKIPLTKNQNTLSSDIGTLSITYWSNLIQQLNADLSTAESNITDIEKYTGYTDNDIYGLEVDYENNKFTRLAGAANKSGGSDFNNINAYGGRRRCNLTDDGVVTAYYRDEAYTETGALTQAVTVNGTEYPVGTAVQVMVEQPKFYYKVVPLKLEKYTTQNGDTGYHIRKARYYISDTPKDGFKLHPAFIRNGAEKEKIYLSAYEGCLYDVSASSYITDDAGVADFNADKMSSIANAKPMSGLSQNLTRANARKLAENRGAGWEQMYVHTVSATQLLLMIEYGTLNSQAAIGNGIVNKASGTGNESENTGGTSSLGNTSGSVSNGEVSYRGEENTWGNIWKWEDGINVKNPNPFNSGEYGNVYVADNNFSDDTNLLPYEDTNIHPCKTGGGWISAFGYDEKYDWVFIPTEVKGNLSSPVGDMLWNNQTSWRVAELGSPWGLDSEAGAFALRLTDASSGRGRGIGGRLVYIPDANENNRSLKQIDEDLSIMESDYIPKIKLVTYSELVSLKNNNQLIPGCSYRITDYVTTTVQPETQSTGNQFDVIVVADSTNTLNENASAIQHTTSSSDYFYGQKLNSWKLKYDINNDTNKYAWADSTNGKGVIYEIEDEYGNKCGYDFKNIRFKRYKITSDVENLSYFTNEYLGSKLITNNVLVPSNYNIDENDNVYRYTFDFNNTDATLNINGNSDIYCYNNIIEHYVKDNEYTSSKYYLNNIVLYCDPWLCQFYDNRFGMNNYNTTINGHDNYSIIFKAGCYNNIVTNGIYKAVFGVNCRNNIIGANNWETTFGNECSNNLLLNNNVGTHFGNHCYGNTLCQSEAIMGDSCHNNNITESPGIVLGNECYSNNIANAINTTIGDGCYSNNITEPRRCFYVAIGNYCSNNTVASGATLWNATIGNYCSNNTVASGITLRNVIIKDFCKNVTFSENLNNIEYTTIFGNDIQASYILSGAYKGKDLTKAFAHEIANYSNDPWLWYQAREAAGNYSGIYVGDYIPFTGKTFYSPNSQGDCTDCDTKNQTYHAHILGINVYRGTYQGNIFGNNKSYLSNHTDWICKECLTNSEDFYWTSEENPDGEYTNNGTSVQRCPYLLSDIYKFYHSMETSGLSNYLPSSLANMIINKTLHLEQRYVDTNRNAVDSTNISWYQNIGKIWTPTEFEIFGATIMATPKWSCVNAIQYPYFTNWRNRQLTYDDGESFAYWWTASVYSGYSYNAVSVDSDGGYAHWRGVDYSHTYPLCFRTGLSSDAVYNDYPS